MRKTEIRSWPFALTIGAILVVGMVTIAILSIFWTPYEPEALDVAKNLLPPGSEGHLLGTDRLGRDVLSQLMAGAQTSFAISVVATSVAVIPGIFIGLVVAGSHGRLQRFLTRIVDFAVAIPAILTALVLATLLGPSAAAVVVALVLAFIPGVARLTIGPARQILAREYVEAALAYGRRPLFVLLRHVLPNVAPVLIIAVTLLFAQAFLAQAALAYLGIGAQPPTPSWGRMLSEAQPLMNVAPTLVLFPGAAITVSVLGFNLVGDGLRVLLDPQRVVRSRRATAVDTPRPATKPSTELGKGAAL